VSCPLSRTARGQRCNSHTQAVGKKTGSIEATCCVTYASAPEPKVAASAGVDDGIAQRKASGQARVLQGGTGPHLLLECSCARHGPGGHTFFAFDLPAGVRGFATFSRFSFPVGQKSVALPSPLCSPRRCSGGGEVTGSAQHRGDAKTARAICSWALVAAHEKHANATRPPTRFTDPTTACSITGVGWARFAGSLAAAHEKHAVSLSQSSSFSTSIDVLSQAFLNQSSTHQGERYPLGCVRGTPSRVHVLDMAPVTACVCLRGAVALGTCPWWWNSRLVSCSTPRDHASSSRRCSLLLTHGMFVAASLSDASHTLK
jgi:hypothetical protein